MPGTLYWVTQDMFRSSDRILWQVPWLIPDAAISSTVWERLARTNVAIYWILSSVLTVLGRQVCSLSSKLSLSCAKCLCHLNTALWPKVSWLYTCLIIWNVSLADFSKFCQNLTFPRCSNCDSLDFRRSQTTTFHNSDILSEYIAHTQLLLAGTREERTRHRLVLHVSAIVHNSATMRPILETIDYAFSAISSCS
jgi:hypothetical protein